MKQTDKFILIARHAESLEDIDKTAYQFTIDAEMPLSKDGRKQASKLARRIGNSFNATRLHLVISPSKRVLETAEIIQDELSKSVKVTLETDARIIKQDWGDVTIHNRAEIEKERYRVGVLRYQFPNGEGGTEFLSRFETFAKHLLKKMDTNLTPNVLIITHGFEMRVLLKSILGWSEKYFETLAHPHNCEMKKIAILNGNDRRLLDKMRTYNSSKNPDFIQRQDYKL